MGVSVAWPLLDPITVVSSRRWSCGTARSSMQWPMRPRSPEVRRAVAIVAVLVLLVVVGLIIVGMVSGGARDQDLTVRRLEACQAFYAAEAGINLSIRELLTAVDEDGDGTAGTISDDGIDATDPAIGTARVVVTATGASPTVLTSTGRSGTARRRVTASIE